MPSVSPLDLLFARRRLLAGDVVYGKEFARLERRRLRPPYRARYEAALAALSREGTDARDAVLALLFDGRLPADEREMSALINGLDAVKRHLQQHGPPLRVRVRPGCRPVADPKTIAA